LEILRLIDNGINDISPLNKLRRLRSLFLGNNNIEDISYLSEMIELEHLSLYGNRRISELKPISPLAHLSWLDLRDCCINNISPLSKLVHLNYLNLSDNEIGDIRGVEKMVELRALHMENNNIIDLSPMSKLTNLYKISLSGNKIIDIGSILKIEFKDAAAVTIRLLNNPLSDKAIYEDIPALEARGVTVWYDKPADYDPSKIKLLDETTKEKTESD
jgi:Leucine-rich repeat (LRR) protein